MSSHPILGSTLTTARSSTSSTSTSTSSRPGLSRPSTYSSRDITHPHNNPTYLLADSADALRNGIKSPYGMLMMFSIFINYVIDTGALGLPYAFVQSGWLLSTITLILSGVLSTITVLFTLEAMARTNGVLEWKERQEKKWRNRRKKAKDVAIGGIVVVDGTHRPGNDSISPMPSTPALAELSTPPISQHDLNIKPPLDPMLSNSSTGSSGSEDDIEAMAAAASAAATSAMDDDEADALDVSTYSPNELDHERDVLTSLRESLRRNKSINPVAQRIGYQSSGYDGEEGEEVGSSVFNTPVRTPMNAKMNKNASYNSLSPSGNITVTMNGSSTASRDGVRRKVEFSENSFLPRVGSKTLLVNVSSPPHASSSSSSSSAAAASSSSSSSSHHLLTSPHSHIVSNGRSVSGNHLTVGTTVASESSPLLNPLATGRGYSITSPAHDLQNEHLLLHNKPIHHLSYRTCDFTLMSQLFGGWRLTFLTQFSVVIFSYVSLWVTAAIFVQSVNTLYFQYSSGKECNIYEGPSQTQGQCEQGYLYILGGYSVLVLILSLRDLGETSLIQGVLTIYRFSAFFLMGATCIYASFNPAYNYYSSKDGVHPSQWSPEDNLTVVIPDVNWSKFNSIFTISAVSFVVQYNLPDIIQPLRTGYKRHTSGLISILLGAMFLCVGAYIALGLVCALTLGMYSYPLITLNWTHYTGLEGGWGLLDVKNGQTVPVWAEAIKLFIMLFPVVSMISCFPLIAISLSENIRSSIPKRFTLQYSNDQLKFASRLIACIPPLLLTMLSGQVNFIFMLAGFIAFLIQLIIPCLLQWMSIRYCKRIWGKGAELTPFSFGGVLSNPATVILVFLISCAAAIYSIVATIQDPGN